MIDVNRLVQFVREKSLIVKSDKLINNIFWNALARFGSAGLSLLITLLLMGILDVESYGEFTVLYSIYTTIPFFFDLGLNNSFVAIGAKLKSKQPEQYTRMVDVYLSFKTTTLGLICLVTLLGAMLNLYSTAIMIVVVLGAVLGLWECFQTVFVSDQNFRLLSKLVPARNLLALIIILISYFVFHSKDWLSYLYIIMVIPFIMSLFTYWKYFKALTFKINKPKIIELFSVSGWIALFTIVNAVHARVSIYMLKYFSSINRIETTEIGIFSAAFSLLAVINLLTSIFSEAVLPKVSEETSYDYFLFLIRKIVRTIFPMIALGIMAGTVLYFVFSYGFNGKYVNSVDSMVLIGAGMILTFYNHTLTTIFYPLNRTDLVFKSILIMFSVNVIVGYFLIPIYGAIGAAITSVIVALAGLLFTSLSLRKILMKNETNRT